MAVNNPLLAKEGKRGGLKFIRFSQLFEQLQTDFISYYLPINLFIFKPSTPDNIYYLYLIANIHNIRT